MDEGKREDRSGAQVRLDDRQRARRAASRRWLVLGCQGMGRGAARKKRLFQPKTLS